MTENPGERRNQYIPIDYNRNISFNTDPNYNYNPDKSATLAELVCMTPEERKIAIEKELIRRDRRNL